MTGAATRRKSTVSCLPQDRKFSEKSCSFLSLKREELQFFVPEANVAKYDQKFRDPRGQCSDSSSADAHFRKSEAAENQHIVDTSVNNQRNNGNIKGNFDRSDTPECRHQYICKNEERECEQNDLQIHLSLVYDRRISCKKAQQLNREQAAYCRKEEAACQAKLQRHSRDLPHRRHPPLAVVLGCQDDVCVTDRNGRLLYQKENLVYRRGARKRCL